jgi:hypothetical protein
VQKVVDGQETPTNDDSTPLLAGIVHDEPFHWDSPPEADMQNDAVTQEMDETEPQSPLVACQADPCMAKAFPSASTAAQ